LGGGEQELRALTTVYCVRRLMACDVSPQPAGA
jgi:hypothetical protein